nr:hypothetical protein [Tanacetum cinerariifolium]
MAYWEDPIQHIGYESASTIVEIDLTWSLGLVSVELASVEARISLIKLEFSSCLFVNSFINLLLVSSIDCLCSWHRYAVSSLMDNVYMISEQDKDLLNSNDPQVVSEPFGRTLNKRTLFVHKRLFSDSMESLSPQVVAAAKLSILNLNEFDLWKMRIEQYFLMTDYSLWEVILNGDSPTPTRVVDGVVQAIAPTTAEQRLAKKNELKARGTLLMALLDKHQLKFNIHKDPQNINVNAAFDIKENESEVHVSPSSSGKTKKQDEKAKRGSKRKSLVDLSIGVRDLSDEFEEFSVNSTNGVNAASTPVTAVRPNLINSTYSFNAAGPSNNAVSPNFEIGGKSLFVDPSQYPDDPNIPDLEDIVYSNDEEDVGTEADFSNLETSITVSPIPTTRVHKDNPVTQIIAALSLAPRTRSMTRMFKEQCGLTQINDEDFHTCMFTCFLSQKEPKRVHQALKDPSWIEAMQEELLQFKMQKVWVLVDLPKGKRAIGSKWEEVIDYEEVFAPVVRIEALGLFLAYASFMGFMVYQMDVKSVFLYGTIKEKVYVCQHLVFKDDGYLDKVYKVVKALYELHQALRAWYETLANYLLENGFQRGKIDQTLFIKKQKGLQVKQKDNGIFISQDKYVAEILRKFGLTDGKSASTHIDTEKPLLKDPDGEDVDVHIYRSMIGSLMYLTSSRPDIMFVVCACAHFQVTPKVLHLHAVKRIFRYLKGKPNLGLCYPKDSPFNLVAYSDSDYAGASLDRKSKTREAEYVAAASCCAQVLWIQNQLLDYGKKVIITEDTIRQALRLDDADGIDCLPNEEIFAELARRIGKGFLGVKTPLFDAMLVQQQVHVDAEVQEAEDDNEVSVVPTLPSPTPATTPPPPQQEPIPSPPQAKSAQPPSPLQQQPNRTANISMTLLNQLMETCATLTKQVANLEQDKSAQALEIVKLKQRVRRLEKKRRTKHSGLKRLKKGIAKLDANEDVTLVDVDAEVEVNANMQGMLAESQAKAYHLDLQHDEKVLKVVTTDTPIKTAAQVPKLSVLRKKRDVVIQDPKEIASASIIMHSEVKSKEKGKGIIIEEPKPLKRQAQIKQDESFARHLGRKNMMIYLKNMAVFKMDFFKGMTYNEIRPIFEKHYNSIRDFLEKDDEEVAVQEKRQSDNLEQDTAKKQRIDEDAEELKTCLQIVVNYDDDVYTEATPLASKVPVVDYEIHHENNKPYYKIIRADGTHKLFLSFITLLKNFD